MAGRPFFESSKPIRVEGGIKARNRRGSIGTEWWSRRFIDVLESIADRGRLQRGRTYARQGQVLSLRVDAYEVTAKVQGSRSTPYDVALGIDVIDDQAWQEIEQALALRAVFRARLLAGEMPPEIEELFAEFGTPLFPESWDELYVMCNCPDWGDPCKHAAAALYVLAEAFDDDPFLILAWNGRTKDQLLAGLRRAVSAAPDPLYVEDSPLTADGFWAPAAGLARLRERPPTPPAPPDFLLRLLDPPPIKVRRKPLADVLAPAYDALARLAPER
jgi:uncharacterized Zn finger protein